MHNIITLAKYNQQALWYEPREQLTYVVLKERMKSLDERERGLGEGGGVGGGKGVRRGAPRQLRPANHTNQNTY